MAIRYLLDTNICIYIAKRRPPEILQRFSELSYDEVGMSMISYGELFCGAQKSQHKETALEKLAMLKQHIPVLSLSTKVADYYGLIRAQLVQKSTPIGNNDLWIAAHALDLQLTLVSNNLKEFARIDELSVENWIHPNAN